ncbi:flippase [Guyparkeria sp. SCN-R1]|nr:flippase [Guyparkeria sp. SCN-R1]
MGSLVIRAGNALLAFAVAVVLARMLGPERYGIYSFALAILMLTAIPAQVGVPQLVVRETARSQVTGDGGAMRGLWRWASVAVLLFSGGAFLVVATLTLWTHSFGESNRVDTLLAGLVLIPLMAFTNVGGACVRGLRKVLLGQLPESIVRPGVLLLLLLGWLAFVQPKAEFSAERAMLLYVVAAIVALIVATLLLWRLRPEELRANPEPVYRSSEWRSAVIPLALISGLHVVNSYADLIILGLFRPDDEVGIYRAVAQFALLIIFGLQAISQVLHPHFARLYAIGNKKILQRLVTTSARAILALALIPFLTVLFFGGDLLSLVFGSEYTGGATALVILAFGQLANAAFGSVGALLNMTGHERDTMRGMLIAMGVNVVLNVVLVPMYGMNGAAIATATSLFLWNAVLRHYVRKRLSIESSAFRVG